MAELSSPIDIVGLREKLQGLTLEGLKQEFINLGIEEAYKNGANKASLVEKGIAAYVEKNTVSENQVGTIEPTLEEQIPEGEYDVDADTLIEFPQLIELGFSVGDILVHEEGKPIFKKEVTNLVSNIEVVEEEELVGSDHPDFGTQGIGTRKTIEEADEEIKGLNSQIPGAISEDTIEDNSEIDTTSEIVSEIEVEDGEYVPEVIDETKYTEEELEENIEICSANCNQALPETRILLLRKIDALELALERKRK